MKKVYGIDLGTTYSCISMVDEHNKPIVLNNSDGQRITPSVIFFEEDGLGGMNIDVGLSAKSYAVMYPNNVVSFVKRQMGKEDYSFEFRGESYRAETLSSFILKKLVQDAELEVGEKIEDVVITVPAYFGINEREATKIAGEIAGLNVVDIINEPTAAALSYGVTKDTEKRILVYDLGGGTFDVTLIKVSTESIEVVSSYGDHDLGGKNWDDMIVEYLVQKFVEEHGQVDGDIRENPETAQDLQKIAEEAKKLLTNRVKVPLKVTHNTDSTRVELTREKFEELTEHLLERTIDFTNLMLAEAADKGPGEDKFDDIILVGGSTRMLQVRRRLVEEFGQEPIVFDPDEAVAKGAALYGQRKSIQEWVKNEVQEIVKNDFTLEKGPHDTMEQLDQLAPEVQQKVLEEAAQIFQLSPKNVESIAKQKIKNVTSKSFGVVVYMPSEERDQIVNMLKRNETLPCECTQQFYTRFDDQKNVSLCVMENAFLDRTIEVEDGVEIGEALLKLPPGLPKDAPIKVTYQLQEDGCLNVTGYEMTSQNTINITIETNSVIALEEIEQAKLVVKDITFL